MSNSLFRFESEMKDPVTQWCLSRGFSVKNEFQTQWGVCDVVACSLDPEKVGRRGVSKKKRKLNSHLRISILLSIPAKRAKRSISFQEIWLRYKQYYDENEINQELSTLLNDGFVAQNKEGKYHRIDDSYPLHSNLVAIELKLSRISDAIIQAHNNLLFADESYVGLPIDVAREIRADSERKREIVENGIGLLGVDKDDCHVLIDAPKSAHHKNRVFQIQYSESFLKG